jgi:hypothetical protein
VNRNKKKHTKIYIRLYQINLLTIFYEIKHSLFNTFRFTSESTTAGDLPPNSKATGVKCFAAAAITILPTLPFPQNIKREKEEKENKKEEDGD